MDLRRESDIEQLRRVALAQQVQIEQLLRVLRAKCAELATLKGSEKELQQTLQLLEDLTARRAQASSSEEVSTTQTQGDEDKPRKDREHFGNTEQPKLPHVEQLFELDEADKTCPSCGGALAPMKGQFETSEMIDVVEVSYRVVQVKQQKYACKCGGCVETAPGPERAVPGGRYSLDFAIKVAIDKYLDHIPLARQERILRRHGLIVTSQTLWDQLSVLGRRLESASRALLARVLAQPVVGLDQTSWPRLDGKGDKPWQMWCLTAPKAVVHRIRDDKGADTFKSLMSGYEGVIVCDALKTHEAGARGNEAIALAGCWAHVFRKFEEAAPDHPEANLALQWTGELYAIDERAEGDLAKKAALRKVESAEVIATMKTWLWNQATLKSLSIGNAAAYVVANWERLTRFLNDARIPLDNNATERGIRGPVVGRKNHYGSKSRRGTEVAAIFYTLLETAKLAGVDPATYLREAALAGARGEVLLPHDFAPWRLSQVRYAALASDRGEPLLPTK
jgi:transposase